MSPRVGFFFLFVIVPVLARRTGGHSYPSSHGYSGTQTHQQHSSYPTSHDSGISHQQKSNVHSQSASYPQSTGLSGNNRASHSTNYVHKTEVHNHYYSPPQQISYGTGYHPVYHERPPVYVYEYRDSGSRFNNLLTGLALYNLGRMSARQDHYGHHSSYSQNPGETCKLEIRKRNGDYEATRIDCQLMSTFIWDAQKEPSREITANKVTTTVDVTRTETSSSNTSDNTVTTTVQKTTVVDALSDKGPSIQVTPEMKCSMSRYSRNTLTLRKEVDCGLLQAYAESSFRNYSMRYLPSIVLTISLTIITFLTF